MLSPKKVWVNTIRKLRLDPSQASAVNPNFSFDGLVMSCDVLSTRNILLVIAGYLVSFHCHEGSWTG